jgi:hypothetical protein
MVPWLRQSLWGPVFLRKGGCPKRRRRFHELNTKSFQQEKYAGVLVGTLQAFAHADAYVSWNLWKREVFLQAGHSIQLPPFGNSGLEGKAQSP